MDGMRTGLEALGFQREHRPPGKESWIRTLGADPIPDTEAKLLGNVVPYLPEASFRYTNRYLNERPSPGDNLSI